MGTLSARHYVRDGTVQSIGYRTIKPETEAIADMGRFLFHQQWFDQPNDPFHRSPSIITYDDEAGKASHAGRARLDGRPER